MREIKPVKKLNFYPEFELPRKVAFHAIMGDYIHDFMQFNKELNPQTDYPKLVEGILVSYLTHQDASAIESKMDQVLPVLLDFINNYPKTVDEHKASNQGYNDLPRYLQLVLLYAESRVIVPSLSYWEVLLNSISFDQSRGCYTSEGLRDESQRFDCYLSDLFRAELNDFFKFFAAPPHNTKFILEKDLKKGGDPNSERSIHTTLSIKASDRVPTNPNTFYKEKFGKLFKILDEIQPTHDDILALDWCVRDWLALAREYLESKDKAKRYLAINILEALIHEFESGFWDAKMRHILATHPDVMLELRKRLNIAAQLFMANLDIYNKKDYQSLCKRFQYLEYVCHKGILIYLTPIVEAIESLACNN